MVKPSILSICLLISITTAGAQFSPGLKADLKVEGMLQSATRRQLRMLPSASLVFVPVALRSIRTRVDLTTLYDGVKSDASPLSISRRHVVEVEQIVALGSGERYFAAAKGEAYHNNVLGMRLQQSYGAGINSRLFSVSKRRKLTPSHPGCDCPDSDVNVTTQTFSVAGDVRYINQQFFKQERQRFVAFVVGQRLFQDLRVASVTESFFFTAPIAETESSWQFRALASLNFPIWRGLSFSLTGFNDYVRNAPAGFRKNFYTINTGFAFTR